PYGLLEGLYVNAPARQLLAHPDEQPGLTLASRSDARASNSVGEVVVRGRRVVDAVPASASGAALEAEELSVKPRYIEELEAPGVHEGQQVSVQLGLRVVRWLVGDAVRLEPLAGPFAPVTITLHGPHAVGFQ